MEGIRTGARSCDRAREWASLKRDGELSDFEHALLAAHLARCADCRSFEADLAVLTGSMRATPLERRERSFTLPRRRHVAFRGLQVGAAAAAVVIAAVGLAGAGGSLRSGDEARRNAALAQPGENTLLREVQARALKAEVPVLAVVQRGLGIPLSGNVLGT